MVSEALIAALKLPLDQRGARRAAARAEWASAQREPLKLDEIVE
jgi:chromosome partitioning protein